MKWQTTSGGLIVPAAPERPVAAVDLFAGCGGFSLGLEAAGIDVVAAVEWDAVAAMTYLWNLGNRRFGAAVSYGDSVDRARFHDALARSRSKCGGLEVRPGDPHWIGWRNQHADRGCRVMHVGDAQQLRGDDLLDTLAATGWRGEIQVVVGGPPCQGFSIAANGHRHDWDPRNNLVLEFVRLAGELGAAVFVMENVTPLVKEEQYRPLFRALVERAHEAGFDTVCADVIDAVNYGVPQHRRRAIVTGSRGGVSLRLPMPEHFSFVHRAGEGGGLMPREHHDDHPPTSQRQLFGDA
jgi:DNA (cytosine-5)-methyltransferase 1